MDQTNAKAPPRVRFLDPTTPPHIVTLVLIAGLSALTMNLILPSLPTLTAYFEEDYALVQTAISGYLATTSVLQLLIGSLSDRYGRRPVILVALLIFLLATIGAIFSSTFEVFLAFRMMQAAVVTGLVLSRAVVRDMVPMDQAASMIAYVTMGMTLAPMIGPTIGGFLEEAYGWQASFMFLLVSGVVVLFITWFDLAETNHNRTSSMAGQFRSYPELLTSRRFWGFTLTLAFTTGAFFAFLGGAPFVAEYHLHLGPTLLGLYFALIGLGYMIGNYFSARYSVRIGVFPMMMSGNVVMSAGLLLACLLAFAGWVTPYTFFGPLFFVGLGNGMTLPSANAGVVSVRPHLAGSAAGLSGAMMIGGGAGLSVLAGILLTPQSGPLPLLILMLISGILAFLSSLYTWHVDRTSDRALESGIRR